MLNHNHEDISIAYHESGHAVVAAVLGRAVDSLVLDASGGRANVDTRWADSDEATDSAAVVMAGDIAEQMFAGGLRTPSDGPGSDAERLNFIASSACPDNPEVWVKRAALRAAVILKGHSAQVYRVAGDLLTKGRVRGDHRVIASLRAAFDATHRRPVTALNSRSTRRRIGPTRLANVCTLAMDGSPI